MNDNLHLFDKLIRIILSTLLIVLMLIIQEDIVLAMLCGLLGVYLTLTAALGVCPLYLFLGINTKTGNTNRFY